MGTAEQTLIVLAVMAVLFVTEIIPLAITSLGGAITLGLMGIITPKVVFSGLSDSTVVLFAGMFVVGAALFYIRKEKKKGACVGCPYSTRCQKHHPGDSDHSCDCHTEK